MIINENGWGAPKVNPIKPEKAKKEVPVEEVVEEKDAEQE